MKTPLKTIILIVLAVVIVGAAAYALFTNKALSPTGDTPTSQTAARVYTNFQHDLRFKYPKGFTLTEKEVGNAEREHYQIMLVKDADAVPPVGGEGPVSITFDFYKKDPREQLPLNWITDDTASNYRLGDGKIADATVAGHDAQSYTWSGLYEGKTTVLSHEDEIVAISVTWLSKDDDIIDAYEGILTSLEFGNFKP